MSSSWLICAACWSNFPATNWNHYFPTDGFLVPGGPGRQPNTTEPEKRQHQESSPLAFFTRSQYLLADS